jgi:hypothetical protein
MSNKTEINIELIEHVILNKRVEGVKTKTWFPVPNDIIGHPDFFKITGDQIKVYLWIRGVFSKTGKDQIRVHLGLCAKDCEVEISTVVETIEKLNTKRWKVLDEHSPSTSMCSSNPKRDSRREEKREEKKREEEKRKEKNYGEVENQPSPIEVIPIRVKSIPNTEGNRKAWDAYFFAYLDRYGVEAIKNKPANYCIADFVKRVGEQDAPAILSFYVQHNDSFYLKATHQLNLALRDAESLRTQWMKGKAITMSDVRKFEKQHENNTMVTELRSGKL